MSADMGSTQPSTDGATEAESIGSNPSSDNYFDWPIRYEQDPFDDDAAMSVADGDYHESALNYTENRDEDETNQDCRTCGMVELASDRLLQLVNTLSLDPWTVRPIVVYGDFDKHYVFAVRKPSAVFNDIKNKVNGVVDPLLRKSRRSKVYKTLKNMVEEPFNKIKFMREPEKESTHTNVTTKKGVCNMVTELAKLPADGETMALSFDCEGDNLGRYGTTCYVQIRNNITEDVYLVDLLTLGQKAWHTTGKDSTTTLKDIFEDPKLVKLIFDVRSDSDAFYNDYGVKLAGVLDVQYLDMLGKRFYSDRRPGYNRAMANADCLDYSQGTRFAMHKQYPYGKDYSRFLDRPLPQCLKVYAVNDVLFLHILAAKLRENLTTRGLQCAFEWTAKEIEWTWEEEYYEDHYCMDDDPYARACTKYAFGECWKERVNNRQEPHDL
ncbi:hypothetical protein LTS08_008202 [Lithohypha guttulata]|nr:hypothetical protein LTS08_008202 [Lithohypha guttulata]